MNEQAVQLIKRLRAVVSINTFPPIASNELLTEAADMLEQLTVDAIVIKQADDDRAWDSAITVPASTAREPQDVRAAFRAGMSYGIHRPGWTKDQAWEDYCGSIGRSPSSPSSGEQG